ncbi:putative esterase [Amycolatopsis echigonensis]|uniref:Acyl-CoA:diacylglycerol acyltransferase n=1 Tax=Amycolatopsis echigonensis TaxID=2576905 RepID=A0A2N3X1L3_9PSEU|nr:alpha/beta hydrolase-fold protein [Amycolatopsis niigatensis]PKV99984.1 putative esterase [Amycolatopsis niigatensis]
MTFRRRHRLAIAGSVAVLAALAPAAATAAEPSPIAAAQAAVAALPAPYSNWNVTLGASTSEPGALTLSYDSPALGERTENSVYLPDSYSPTGGAAPVMYYLHGTVVPSLDNPSLAPVTSYESLLNMVGSGGGFTQTKLEDFPSQAGRANFIVVAPDTDPSRSWCHTCMWTDGKPGALQAPPLTASTVPAETVVMKEIIPLTEAIFNARTDRGGRGVIGFSMGGGAAEVLGFRHPDEFSYVGAISGPFDVVDDPYWNPWVEANGYFRDQGYGTSLTDNVEWRNVNPKDLAGNWAGTGGHLMLSAGDACAPPTDAEGAADCTRYPALTNPAATLTETQMRRSADESVPQLAAAGVQAEQFRASGIHGANNHRVYADVIVPQANALFASTVPTPEKVNYKNAYQTFSAWGYTVSRSSTTPAFVTLTDARLDAGSFTVSAESPAQVTTPAAFTPGRTYRVGIAKPGSSPENSDIVADGAGRLTLQLDPSDGAVTVTVDTTA